MKKFMLCFYIFLFTLSSVGMIICIYGIVVKKELIYFVAGIVCYVLQNIIISLIYNDKEIHKKKKEEKK